MRIVASVYTKSMYNENNKPISCIAGGARNNIF